jgi:hypothetical protein
MNEELIRQSSGIGLHDMPWGFLLMAAIVIVLIIVVKNLLK